MTTRTIANRRRSLAKARPALRRSSLPVEMLEGRTLFNATYHNLAGGAFTQDWSGTAALITTADNWDSVPSIIGYAGGGSALNVPTPTNPQTLLLPGVNDVEITPNQTNVENGASGIFEFESLQTVAIQASGSSPHMIFHMNATGRENIQVAYDLVELDTSNANQLFALQWRAGNTGNFTNVPTGANPSGYFSAAGAQTFNVSATLPAGANNQAELQIRVITIDASGNDSMIGVDNINISSAVGTGQYVGFPTPSPVVFAETGGDVQLTVTRGPVTTGTSVISYATSNGTATAPADYTAASGNLTFLPGETSKLITIPVIDDTEFEPNQSFTVTLASVSGPATLQNAVRQVIITDNDKPTGGKVLADGPLTQNWNDVNQITTDDDWSGVAYFTGYRGDDLVTTTGANPQDVLNFQDETAPIVPNPVDVNANLSFSSASTFNSGGVIEFESIVQAAPPAFQYPAADLTTNPAIAFNGSGTADAPFLLFEVNTVGITSVDVAYNVRDMDPSTDDAVQPVALQYRIGNTGNFTNVPSAFIADATTGGAGAGPKATLVTPVSVTVPGIGGNALVQFRVITTNAVGNDEFIGIDDIVVQSTPQAPGALTFFTPTYTYTEGQAFAQVEVVRAGGALGAVTVQYATSNGTATAPGDYTTTTGTLTFTAGDTSEFIQIPITNDTTPEIAEKFTVTLSNPGMGGTLGNTTTTTVTLLDNDYTRLSDGPYSQNWDADLTVNDYWGGLIGVRGYLGTGLAPDPTEETPPVDVQLIVAPGTDTPLDLNVNQTTPDDFTTGGVTEFEGDDFAVANDRVVALAGSGTADAPFLLFEVNSLGVAQVDVSYRLRDLEIAGGNGHAQPIALQYRVGNTGDFINVPAAYVADATGGLDEADPILVTLVDATLPAEAANKPLLQIRVITHNAFGNDEWVGVDDILIEGSGTAPVLPAWLDPTSIASYDTVTDTLTVTGAAKIIADPADFPDDDHPAIIVTATGSLIVEPPTSDLIVNVGSLDIDAGGTATIAAMANGANNRVLVVEGALTIDGKLDVTNNAMVLKNSSLAAVTPLISSGYAGSAWNGNGINSSSAAANELFSTAVGFASNADAFYDEFEGVTVDGDDILIKYTYLGDADLNGAANLDDYPLFSAGLDDDATGGPNVLANTWFYGDFDYNGIVNLDDFPLFTYGVDNNGSEE